MARTVPPLDLLIQATTPPDEITHPLVFGRSTLNAFLDLTKIRRKALIESEDVAPGWRRFGGEMVSVLVDPDGILQAFWYGIEADELTWQVHDAATVELAMRTVIEEYGTREEPHPYPQITAGKMPIHLGGRDIRAFALLPEFIGITDQVTPRDGDKAFPPPIPWFLNSLEMDKWISLRTELPYANFNAEFLLKALKPKYQGRFVFDYCLNSIGIMTKAAASR